jgi:hypothetical protein
MFARMQTTGVSRDTPPGKKRGACLGPYTTAASCKKEPLAMKTFGRIVKSIFLTALIVPVGALFALLGGVIAAGIAGLAVMAAVMMVVAFLLLAVWDLA